MSTKATVTQVKPASNNTTKEGTTTMTKPAANEVFTPVTEAEDKEYTDLHSKHLDLDDVQEARYMELAKKIRAAKSQKAGFIKDIKSKLTNAAVAIREIFSADDIKAEFGLKDLFTAEELKAEIMKHNFEVSDLFTADKIKALSKPAKNTTGTTTVRTGTVRPSDADIELFFFPKSGSRGDRDFILKRGRITERYNDTVATPFIVNETNFPKKLLALAADEKELMKHVTTTDRIKAEEYLATPAGQEEIAKILEVVSKAKAKLSPASKDKTAA